MKPDLDDAYFARLRNQGMQTIGTVTGTYIDEDYKVKVFAKGHKRWEGRVDSPSGATNTWIVVLNRVPQNGQPTEDERFGREEISVTVENPGGEVSDPFPTSTDVP